MNKRTREMFMDRFDLLSETVESLKAIDFPEGRVSIKYMQGRPYYYLSIADKKEKYLGKKDRAVIRKLVQKAYVKEVIKLSEHEMRMISDILRLYGNAMPEDVYENLPDARKRFATPVSIGNNRIAADWADEPYDRLPFKKDTPEYITMKGDRVRSKSEMIIADRLFVNGIPYKYECPLLVNGQIIHPDFTILRLSDLRILYHEHCGMVDYAEYAERMVTKINDYNKEGICLGDRLFVSMESSKTPLDVRTIDNLINLYR